MKKKIKELTHDEREKYFCDKCYCSADNHSCLENRYCPLMDKEAEVEVDEKES